MKKYVLLFWVLLVVTYLRSCSLHSKEASIDNAEKSDIAQTNRNSENYFPATTEKPQPDWEHLDVGVLNDRATTVNEIHFLVTEEVSLEGQIYKTEIDNTNMLLELLHNLHVKKIYDTFSYADYYLLFRDKNDTAICLIAVWNKYICVNNSDFYEVSGDELFLAIEKIIGESKEMGKVPIESILISYAKENLYGKFNEEDIVLYHGQPAILVETGYENNYSEEQFYYERFIYYDGSYFDQDYQTTYMISQSQIYYCQNNIQDVYTKRVAYYDYFTGKKMMFLY